MGAKRSEAMKTHLLLFGNLSKERIKKFGRSYYSKNSERTLFFIFTLAMLAMGLLYKTNLW